MLLNDKEVIVLLFNRGGNLNYFLIVFQWD